MNGDTFTFPLCCMLVPHLTFKPKMKLRISSKLSQAAIKSNTEFLQETILYDWSMIVLMPFITTNNIYIFLLG